MKAKEEFKNIVKVISLKRQIWERAKMATEERIKSYNEALEVDKSFLRLCEQKIKEEEFIEIMADKNKKSD